MSNQTLGDWPDHPSLEEYYLNLTPFVLMSIFVSILLVILNILIYCTTIAKLRKRLDSKYRSSSIALWSFYPIISLAACITILVPHVWLVCHTVMHLSFTISAVIFRHLCFRYVDGEINFVKETDGNAVALNTPPCCCCCLFLPLTVPSKKKFALLRIMVWQMPFVQGSIMLVLNVFYYREPELYQNLLFYFIPFIISSILVGLWALNITIRMISGIRPDYMLPKKMFCMQLILILCKLQYMVLDTVFNNFPIKGAEFAFNSTILKQTIINMLILVEMVLVSMMVQNSYKFPVQLTELTAITK